MATTCRKSSCRLFLATACAFASIAAAGEVTVSLLTQEAGKLVPLDPYNELRRSPYGGWVTIMWPFNMKIGDTPILGYRSELLEQAWAMKDEGEAATELEADDAFRAELGISGPAVVPDIERSSSAKVSLPEGESLLMPGGVRVTTRQGKLSSDDPRARVNPAEGLVEVICWPVTFRALDGLCSVAVPMLISYDGTDLVQGVLKPLEDPEKRKRPQKDEQESGRDRFRRITMYLPPSTGGKQYYFNGVPFTVDMQGKVSLTDTRRVELVGKAELRFRPPTGPPTRIVGKRRLDPGAASEVAGHPNLPLCPKGSSWESIAVGTDQKGLSVSFGTKGQQSQAFSIPNTFNDLPYKTAILGASSGAGYLFETEQFALSPGGNYSCRLYPVGSRTKPGTALDLRLVPLYRDAQRIGLKLTGGGDGTFEGKLPPEVGQGLWQVATGDDGPLKGVSVALLLVTDQKSPATVSLYTYRNRAGFLRGDQVDLYWTVRVPAGITPPGDFEVVLQGHCLERVIARGTGGPAAALTGHARLNTTALSPGLYHVRVRPESILSYPTHFFVYQRELLSDFGVNSYTPFGDTKPDAGSAISTYYCQGTGAGQPGLEPVTDQARSGLDVALAACSTHPSGPAAEKFIRPDEDEVGLMTLARAGKRAVLQMPVMLHHEEWNPKHTLPEELRQLRRRNALFTQKYADLAGFTGINFNWYATLSGYWEESKPLDGHQGLRNAEAGKWVTQRAAERIEAAKARNTDPKDLEVLQKQAHYDFWSLVLPTAYEQYLADAKVIRPDITSHSGIPSFWLGGGASYPPLAYSTLTHRDCVDYTDYCRPPWSEFRAPAFFGMHNPARQMTQMCTAAAGRHARFIVAFGGAGRGLDGFAFPGGDVLSDDHQGLLRIFQRLGSYFRALDPLTDVAVYFSKTAAWAHQKSVILHDLARLRRPGVLLAEEDVLRGELDKYQVLFLAAVSEETAAVRQAFAKFQERGGFIVKDAYVAKSFPGIDLGFAYDDKQVPGGAWGLGGPDGEWEFAHLWVNFLEHREKHLLKAFENAPKMPVTTSDKEIVISPLAGKESLCCFVINETYVPMSVEGKYRQHFTLPRPGDLIVDKGWHVRDLLTGKPCALTEKDGRNTVALDFTRMEGQIFLLSKREMTSMKMRTRRATGGMALEAWLEDAQGVLLPDPVPFEVRLTGPAPGPGDLFHKYAALSPTLPLPVPLPEVTQGTELTLTVRDLVLGSTAQQAVRLQPASPAVAAEDPEGSLDVIGGKQIADFLRRRKNHVLVLVDEAQERYRPAAEAMVALLKKNGRDARLKTLDAAEVREQPLRWKWTPEDEAFLKKVAAGEEIAWRVPLPPFDKEFDDPLCGFAEYGPPTWIAGDVVLFGGPDDNRALQDLDEFLRRRPSPNYPSPGRFFLHYVWDPFQGGSDGLYIGCKDPAGAEAAVRYLAGMKDVPEAPRPATEGEPVVTKAGEPTGVEDMVSGRFGSAIMDVAYSPSGERIFLTVDAHGDSFFVLSPNGEILESRPIQNRLGNSVFGQGNGGLRPLSNEEVYLNLWASDYLLHVRKGFLERAVSPYHGLPGRIQVSPGGPVLLRDFERQRTYLGGKVQLVALGKDGQVLWRYNDADRRTSTSDMLVRRSLFFRGVSPNGKRLLLTAFGVAEDVYGIGTPCNQSVFCMETGTGKVLWAKDGLYLNRGKAILSDDRFVIVDDDGQFHLLNAETGEPVGKFRAVGGTDIILPIPGTELLLIVENNHFDLRGPSNRSYLRGPGEDPDVRLELPGRIRQAVLTPDAKQVVMSSNSGQTACFGLDGRKRWEVPIPAGGVVRFSPDRKTTLVGSGVGELFFIETASGKVLKTMDFNRFNMTSPEQFVRQLGSIEDVPVAKAAAYPPPVPEPSYLDSLDKNAVHFGPNLLGKNVLLGKLKPANVPEGQPAEPKLVGLLDGAAEFSLKVEPRNTYLVEFLNVSADPGRLTPQTRIEVSLRGAGQSAYLPFTGRLPVGQTFARRRMAFRTEKETQVSLAMRVVVPSKPDKGGRGALSYEPGETSPMPMLLAEPVVAALKFKSRNFLRAAKLDAEALSTGTEGPQPRGWIDLIFHRWSGGDSTFKKWTWKSPMRALGLVDGIIGNQETKWQEASDAVTGTAINYGTATVTFKNPETVTAIAIFEDNRGPLPSADSVREMTTMQYGLYVEGRRLGYVVDNTNLVNIFTFPAVQTRNIVYFWAGREFSSLTDGLIHTAEFEVYSTEESDYRFDEAGDAGKEEKVEEDLKLDTLK